MRTHAELVLNAFRENLRSVERLAEFDRLLVGFAIDHLCTLQTRLERISQNPRHHVTRTIKLLEDIRTNDSLRTQYQEMFNQCVVLQVSYFASAAADLFRRCVPIAVREDRVPPKVLEEDLRLTIRDLRDAGQDLIQQVGDLLIQKKDLSFQDMQSMNRAFRDYLSVNPQNPPAIADQTVNNIILGQACRHAIVHAGAVADARLERQIRSATPRDLKPGLHAGQRIAFTPEELAILGRSMDTYMSEVIARLPRSAEEESNEQEPKDPG